jgi:hypothetical protein
MWDIRRQKCIFNLQGKKRKRTGNLNFQHPSPTDGPQNYMQGPSGWSFLELGIVDHELKIAF